VDEDEILKEVISN